MVVRKAASKYFDVYLGRIIESGTVMNSSKTIHLSSKKAGLYLLKIQNKVYRVIKT